jgi:hypothetical protein
MKTPPLFAVATLLLCAASLHAELGAIATVLQPSREQASKIGLPEGSLDSRVFGGSQSVLFGAVTTNAAIESSRLDRGAMWDLEWLRFNELNQLVNWEVNVVWGTIDRTLELSMLDTSAQLVGGWTAKDDTRSDNYVGNGKVPWMFLHPGDPDSVFDTVESDRIRPIAWIKGTPVDLMPTGATSATVAGTSRSLQVGQAQFGGSPRAIIWRGSASSAQDITPPGASEAGIAATTNSWQAGHAVFAPSTTRCAVAWQGSADMFRNLHPAAASESWLLGTDGSQFVGAASFEGTICAGLWTRATPGSFVNLHPPQMLASEAKSVDSDCQAGSVTTFEGHTHAAFWQGTAKSFLDLHKALGPEYSKSEATFVCIFSDTRYLVSLGGGILYGPVRVGQEPPSGLRKYSFEPVVFPGYILVGGSAYNSVRSCWEAVMWNIREMEAPVLQAVHSDKAVRARRNPKAFSVGFTSRVVVRINGTRHVVRGPEFNRKTRIATRRGAVLRGNGRTYTKIKMRGLKPGINRVIVSASGPGGRARPISLEVIR